jgi:GT2 family glycosyltransferase
MSDRRVTIVVVPREQFSKTRASLESVFASTPPPFELIYVDGRSPPSVRWYLEEQAEARGFRLVRTDRYLPANEARNLALAEVRTEYVAFLDNDVFVLPGWLHALVRCADETGASAVGPLYCFGRDGSSGEPVLVHTAGASLSLERDGDHRYRERHLHVNRPLAEVRAQLCRMEIGLVEFHCMLVRTSVFDRTGPLDEELLSFFDHVDFCLAVHEAGGSVYLEPEALVTHLAPPPFEWGDVPYFLLRWSDAWLQPSIRRFAGKHRLSTSDAGFADHVSFRDEHRRRLISGWRRHILSRLGDLGLRVANRADRLMFDLFLEHAVVRPFLDRPRRTDAERRPLTDASG